MKTFWAFNVCLLAGVLGLSGCTYSGPAQTILLDRYTLHSGGSITILLDKQTGHSWRNVRCPSEDKNAWPLPNCWESMDFVDFAPKAEAKNPTGQMDAVIEQATADSQSEQVDQN